ncbi:hypothetical protein ABIA39_008132 [Nocardia sp. GAS34]
MMSHSAPANPDPWPAPRRRSSAGPRDTPRPPRTGRLPPEVPPCKPACARTESGSTEFAAPTVSGPRSAENGMRCINTGPYHLFSCPVRRQRLLRLLIGGLRVRVPPRLRGLVAQWQSSMFRRRPGSRAHPSLHVRIGGAATAPKSRRGGARCAGNRYFGFHILERVAPVTNSPAAEQISGPLRGNSFATHISGRYRFECARCAGSGYFSDERVAGSNPARTSVRVAQPAEHFANTATAGISGAHLRLTRHRPFTPVGSGAIADSLSDFAIRAQAYTHVRCRPGAILVRGTAFRNK